jgi:lipopolysaccharide biosynthesis protein
MKNLENKRHAIVVHLYYNDLWEEFKKRIEPLLKRGDVDLYVTLTKDDISAKEDIEKLTDKVYVLENRGLDVGPFIFVMNEIKDLNYTSIFKIQTKKSLHHGQNPNFGSNWRRQLVDAIIGDGDIFDEITKILEDEPMSMIGSKLHLVDFKFDSVNIPHHYGVINKTIKELNLNIKETRIGNSVCFSKKGRFFAGTMFATSHKYIKEVFKNCDMIEFYKSLPLGYVYNSSAHAMERIFGYYIDELEGNFYEIE